MKICGINIVKHSAAQTFHTQRFSAKIISLRRTDLTSQTKLQNTSAPRRTTNKFNEIKLSLKLLQGNLARPS